MSEIALNILYLYLFIGVGMVLLMYTILVRTYGKILALIIAILIAIFYPIGFFFLTKGV